MGLFKNFNYGRLKEGLNKTKNQLFSKINETVTGKANIDEATLDELEEILVTSDIGYDLALNIIEKTRIELKKNSDRSKESVIDTIKNELINVFNGKYNDDKTDIKKYKPYVILILGVNGAGKTTTVGKLAYNYRNAGYNVIIGSADTFRAAANDQLNIWAERAGVEIIESKQGADPASVAFETINIAKTKNADIVLIDTAGRLHSKHNLMDELNKIRRVIQKAVEHAPNEVLLVVDGNTGQNALIQAKEFSKYTELTGLVVTKLDGTAKGGAIFQVCSEQNIPVRYIGVGEKIDDLQNFDPEMFVKAIFE